MFFMRNSNRHQKKVKLLNLTFFLFSLSLALFAILISGYYYYMENRRIRDRVKQVQKEYVHTQSALVKSEVKRLAVNIYKARKNLVLNAKNELREYIDKASSMLIFVNDLDLSYSKKLSVIRPYLRFLSFYDGAYSYFLISGSGTILLYPEDYTKEGKNISALSYTAPEIVDAFKAWQDNLFEYKQEDPETGTKIEKFVYLKYYKPLNVYIGAFVNFNLIENGLKKAYLKRVSTTYYGEKKNGYFFVVDYKGNMLASGFNKELVGKNLWNLEDPNGKKIIQEFIKVVKSKGEGFVKYAWKRPSTGRISYKLSFVEGIDMWNWIIGSGFYIDGIKESVAALRVKMENQMKATLARIAFVSFLFAVFFILIFLFIRFFINRDISYFITFFKESLHSNKKINIDKVAYKEFYQLALYANAMLDERKKMEDEIIKREKYYAALVEDLPVMVIRFDKNYKFTFVNKVYLKYFKIEEKEIIGKEIFENISPEDRKKVLEKLENITPDRPLVVIQHKIRLSSGNERWLEWVNRGIFDREGKVMEYSAVGRDITEEKRRGEEDARIQKLESLSFLAGGIAHDFNNIFTGILGKIGLAKFIGKDNKLLIDKLREAELAALRARDLSTKLLTFSKGGAPVKEVIPIDELLKEEVHFSLHGSNVEYTFDIDDDLWPVKVDKSQMGQVIQNLVINAAQAMPQGGKLTVVAENIIIKENSEAPLSPGKYVRIKIKDTGCGIPDDKLKNIFDPYYTTKETGTGLGLAVVYSIIQKHNGRIEVTSKVGEGTEFTIYLPASEGEIKQKEKEEEILFEITGKGRILIMDDDELVASALSEMLSFLGYQSDIAKNGEEAIAMYKKAKKKGIPYNLVIMDLTIRGGMGGKEASKILLSIDPEACIIVSSGYSEDPIMSEYKKYGFKGVLKKPYTINTLSILLNSLINREDDGVV